MTKRSRVTLFGLLALIAAFGLILTGCPDAGGSGGNTTTNIPTNVTVEDDGSWGTAGDSKITLEETGHYLVRNNSTGKWYTTVTDDDGLVMLTGGKLSAANIAAVSNAGTLPEAGKELKPLLNGNSYSVYKYIELAAGAGVGTPVNEGDKDNGGKNAVVNISVTPGETAEVLEGAGNGKNSLIFLTGGTTTPLSAYDEEEDLSDQADIHNGTIFHTFSDVDNAATVKVQAKAADAFITVSKVGATTTATISVTADRTAVRVTKGSPGTGNRNVTLTSGEITVDTGKMYLVYDHINLTLKAVVGADGTLSSSEATLAHPGNNLPAAVLANNTKINGLTAGVYTVYLYSALTNGQSVGGASADVLNNGKNAVLHIGALGDGEKVSVKAGAGDGKNSLIFIIDAAISQNALGTTAVPLGEQENIKGLQYYSFSATTADGAKVTATSTDKVITLSNVGAYTATTITATTLATKVLLGAGSPGTASTTSITNLTPGAMYVVYDGAEYHAVVAGGTLNSTAMELAFGDSNLPADGLTGTEITGLTTGTEYTVYTYGVLEDGESVGGTSSIPTVNNGGKNAILNIGDLGIDESVSVNEGAGAADGNTSLIFLFDGETTTGASVALDDGILKTDSGLSYEFANTTDADGVTYTTESIGKTITLNAVGASTTTTITAIGVKLGKGSQGTRAGDKEIDGLDNTAMYLVHDVDNNAWYKVGTGTSGEIDSTTLTGLTATTAGGTQALSGTTKITGLTNGTTYSVYQYFGTVANNDVIPTTTGRNNGNKNAVYNISTLTVGQKVSVQTGAGAATDKPNLIFLIADAIEVGEDVALPSGTLLAGEQAIKNTTANPLFYGFTTATNAGNGAKIEIADGDAFITLSDVGVSTATTLEVIGVKLAAGSQGIAGDGKITGLVNAHYVVKNVGTGIWYTTTTGATTLTAIANGGAALTPTNISNTSSSGVIQSGGTEITGLTNGVVYDVYLYTTGTGNLTAPAGNKNLMLYTSGSSGAAVTVGADTANGNTIILLITTASAGVLAGTDVVDGGALTNGTKVVDTAGSAVTWTFTVTDTGTATTLWTESDFFVTVTGGSAATDFTFSRS